MKIKSLSILAISISLMPLATLAQDIEMKGSVGIGYDSNIYRTPDKPYTYGVTPAQNLQSGSFTPLDFSIDYKKAKKERDGFFADYSFDGDFYHDSQFSNTNTWNQEFGVGSYFMPGAEARLFLHQTSKQYVDRDSGLNKTSTVTGEDISEKYSYTSVGAELSYDLEANKQWDFGLGMIVESLDYTAPPTGSEYDHNHTEFFAKADFSPRKKTRLKASLNQYTKSYDFREARDLTGSTLGVRPKLEYVYTDIGLEWRERVTKSMVTYLGYSLSDRKDQDVGYNDRTKTTLSFRVLYDITPTLDTKLKISTSSNDYPNAWAYDTNASGLPKTYSSKYIKWQLNYKMEKELTLEGSIRIYDTTTNDTRYDYERNIVSVGVTKNW